MRKEMPEGPCCYLTPVFSESTECPDFNGRESMRPKCDKFDVELEWTVSGRVLKCKECLEGVLCQN